MARLVDLNDTAYENLEKIRQHPPPSFYNNYNQDPSFAEIDEIVEKKKKVPVPKAAYYEQLLTNKDQYAMNKNKSQNSTVSSLLADFDSGGKRSLLSFTPRPESEVSTLLSQADINSDRPRPPPPAVSKSYRGSAFPPPTTAPPPEPFAPPQNRQPNPPPHASRRSLPDQTPYVQALHYHALLQRHVREQSKNAPHPSNSLGVQSVLTDGSVPTTRTTSMDSYVYRGADDSLLRQRRDPPFNNAGTAPLRRGAAAPSSGGARGNPAAATSKGMMLAHHDEKVLYESVARGDAERAERFRCMAERERGEERSTAKDIKHRCAKDSVGPMLFIDDNWR